MTPAPPLIRRYVGLVDAFAAAIAERKVTYEQIDDRCGFPIRYTAKLVCPNPMKRFGPMSLDAMLRLLGKAIVMVDDPDNKPLLTDLRERPGPMLCSLQHNRQTTREARDLLAQMMIRIRKKGARKRRTGYMKLKPATRRRIAKRAARGRWGKRRRFRPRLPRLSEVETPII